MGCLNLWKAALQTEWLLSLALPPALIMKGDEHPSCKPHIGSSCGVAFLCKPDMKKLHKNMLSSIYCTCLSDGRDQLLKRSLLERRKAEELGPNFYLLCSEEPVSNVVHWYSQELNTEDIKFLLILYPLLLTALKASKNK